jgi:hypothetical protein
MRIADGHGPRAPKTVSGNGDSAVRLVGARKIYGDVPAVDGIVLEIAADELFTLPVSLARARRPAWAASPASNAPIIIVTFTRPSRRADLELHQLSQDPPGRRGPRPAADF